MIFFIILLSTINFSRSDEVSKNFKIHDKDIIKFTREDAKDVIITRDESGKSLRINPIITQKRSEIINATSNQLVLRNPVAVVNSDVVESLFLTNDEATRNVEPPNAIITKGIIKHAQDFGANQVPLPINSFATAIKLADNLDEQSSPSKVYFSPLQQFVRKGTVGDPSVHFATNSEEDESIIASQDKHNLPLQSLGLVGFLNLNNYFGISPSSSKEEKDLSNNEPKVFIPNVVLPLEPHNGEELHSASDGEFFVQPIDVDEQFDNDDQSSITFEPIQDYTLDPKRPEDIELEINVLSHEASQLQFFGNEQPTYENNQQGERNAANIWQSSSDEANFKSESTNSYPSDENFGFESLQKAVNPGVQQKEERTSLHSSTLQQSSRSRAINRSPHNSLLHGQSSFPNYQLSQKPQKLTWQSIQINKVNMFPNENSNSDGKDSSANFHSGLHKAISYFSPTISTNNTPNNALQPVQSPVITLQPPGMFPYFSPLPNKSSMIPPNFNQPIHILPEITESSFLRQTPQPVKWLQQNNKAVPLSAIGNQQFDVLERPAKSDNYRSQQGVLADFVPETSASTNVRSSPKKSIYTLKEHRTIYDNTHAQQIQPINSPTLLSKPDDTLPPNEQSILTFLKSQSELYDSQPQEQPIQFFPESSTSENDQLTVQSVSQSSQSQNYLTPSYQSVSLEQPPINKNTEALKEGPTRYEDTLIQPSEDNIPTPDLDAISLEADNSEEIVIISDPPKQDHGKPVEVPTAKTEACATATVFQERFVTVTVISKILETVREPISTSYVTIRDRQTLTRNVKVPPYVRSTVTEYIENSRCITSQSSATRTYGRSLITNTEVPIFPPFTSSYTDYFGEGNPRETLKKTFDRYENNYMEWVNKLKNRNFHIDKDGKPKNIMSLSNGSWPKHFVIDDQFWE